MKLHLGKWMWECSCPGTLLAAVMILDALDCWDRWWDLESELLAAVAKGGSQYPVFPSSASCPYLSPGMHPQIRMLKLHRAWAVLFTSKGVKLYFFTSKRASSKRMATFWLPFMAFIPASRKVLCKPLLKDDIAGWRALLGLLWLKWDLNLLMVFRFKWPLTCMWSVKNLQETSLVLFAIYACLWKTEWGVSYSMLCIDDLLWFFAGKMPLSHDSWKHWCLSKAIPA